MVKSNDFSDLITLLPAVPGMKQIPLWPGMKQIAPFVRIDDHRGRE